MTARDADDAVLTAAAEWFARQHDGTLDPQASAEFDAWLQAAPAHRAAYDTIARTWRDTAPAARDAQARLDRRPTRRRALRTGLIAGLGLAAVGTGWALSRRPWSADYATAPGERFRAILPDGSVADLSTDTAIRLGFDGTRRQVILDRGEAFFDVVSDYNRPFSVAAGPGTVTALGTAFAVAREPEDRVRVAVTRHAVRIEAAGRQATVIAGQGGTYGPNGIGGLRAIDTTLALAWRHGRLVFLSVPLAEVAAALERWRSGRIIVMDKGLADRPVTAIIDVNRPEEVLDTLARSLPIRTVELTPLLTLIYPA